MILHIYANFNVLGGFFGSPVIDHIEPEEMQKDYAQVCAGLSQEVLAHLSECDLYCLGSIDNVTGEVVPEKTFLLHCSDFTSRFLKKSEENEDVRENC